MAGIGLCPPGLMRGCACISRELNSGKGSYGPKEHLGPEIVQSPTAPSLLRTPQDKDVLGKRKHRREMILDRNEYLISIPCRDMLVRAPSLASTTEGMRR